MAHSRQLPLAPPPMPDETISSWLTRIAARYDLSAERLVQHLLPREDDVPALLGRLNYRADEPAERAIAAATNHPTSTFATHRLPWATARPHAWWQRRSPAWCPLCVAEDVAIRGEVHVRRDWGVGCYLMCARHRCLLLTECPLCFGRVSWQPVKGRVRIWCHHCDRCADDALGQEQTPFWPHGTPAQHRSCLAITLSSDAAADLLHLQTDLLGVIAGQPSRGPWGSSLRRVPVIDVISKLTFVMLGPLWADGHRPWPGTGPRPPVEMPDDWTPGWLPPEIAAPALMTTAIFLAAESGLQMDGITWNPQVLLPGEDVRIRAETLLWHLNTRDARLVRTLFPRPIPQPLSLLFEALARDTRGLGRSREEARRRRGADRRARPKTQGRSREAPSDRRRDLCDRGDPAEDRYKLHRVSPWFPGPPPPPPAPFAAAVRFAVYFVIGARVKGLDLMAEAGWPTPLLQNRYVRLWIARHVDAPSDQLVTLLVAALECAALSKSGSILLPELNAARTIRPTSNPLLPGPPDGAAECCPNAGTDPA